jgi:hypothetical protein
MIRDRGVGDGDRNPYNPTASAEGGADEEMLTHPQHFM